MNLRVAFRALGGMVIACCTTACLDTATVVHVNRDGSGTLELSKAMNGALLRDVGRPLASGDVTRTAAPQLVSEADLRRQAERIGGHTFVSSAPITTANGFTGVKAVFAFRDISVLRIPSDVLIPSTADVGPVQASPGRSLTFAFSSTDTGSRLRLA